MSTLFGYIMFYGPVVVFAASAAVNAVNAALPAADTNATWKAIHSAVNFLALNWVKPK